MTKFDCVCFDLDGTICDSKPGILNGLRYAFDYFNEPAQSDQYFLQFIGLSLDKSLAKYTNFSEHKIKEVVKVFREYYGQKGIFDGVLYEGIVEVIESLHQQKIDIYLVTAKPQHFAEEILNHFLLSQYFKGIYGLDPEKEYTGKTPDLKKIRSKGYKNIVMVGDRDLDINAASEAAVNSIAVTYGYGSVKELQDAMPSHIAEKPLDLQNILF